MRTETALLHKLRASPYEVIRLFILNKFILPYQNLRLLNMKYNNFNTAPIVTIFVFSIMLHGIDRGGWMIWNFLMIWVDDLEIWKWTRLFKFILLFVNWVSFWFSISFILLPCYVYYSCIWLGFNLLFSCFFTGFLLFSPKGSVMGCVSSLRSFCYSPVCFLSRMHLHFSYYYYAYVIIGVLRPLWLNRNSQLEVKQQK